jgi:hypothetical protein
MRNLSELDTGLYNIFLRMTDNVTSKYIDLASWDILYRTLMKGKKVNLRGTGGTIEVQHQF